MNLQFIHIILNAYWRADDASDSVSETKADVGSDENLASKLYNVPNSVMTIFAPQPSGKYYLSYLKCLTTLQAAILINTEKKFLFFIVIITVDID